MDDSILEILSDESNVDFVAETNYTARIKFHRLIKKYPSSHEYANCLLQATKDIKNEEEYDKFLCYLANPKKITGTRNPHPSITGEEVPDMSDLLKTRSPSFFEINHENVKDIPNAVFIHIKNVGEISECDEDEEKMIV